MQASKLQHILFKQVSNAPLIVFRIAFGLLMLFSSLRFIAKGWIEPFYVEPKFHFTYLGFDWIKPLGPTAMYVIFGLMAFSALLIALGYKYRVATISFFVLFTYVELIDKTYYLNHYYFVSLIAFLLCFLPANRRFSIDVRLNNNIYSRTTSAWHMYIIMFQLGCVYFFAGIAKINKDWLLDAQPLKLWLHGRHDALPILKEKWIAYFASWFGCLYDLLIPFALIFRKTRPIAYILVVLFHVFTWLLFPIGVFPWVMIICTTIFFSSSFHEKILSHVEKGSYSTPTYIVKRNLGITQLLVGLYVVFQIAIPLRFMLYPGNLFWNEEGYRYSWRVMLMEKHGSAQFYIRNKDTGKEFHIDNKDFLSPRQEKQMVTQPDFIIQYAAHLKELHQGKTYQFDTIQQTWDNIGVHAKIMVTLNGRPSQLFVAKKHDLTEYKYNLCHRKWIEPFKK